MNIRNIIVGAICVALIFLNSCINNQRSKIQYTNEQISSLHINSAEVLNIDEDSAINVNLNKFLTKSTFDFGSHVGHIKFIFPETTDNSLISSIYKIVVSDNEIYIMDNFKGAGLIIFNKDGKFIKRIGHGQGPGELFRLSDIAYDKENDKLIAYQHPFLLTFSSSGDFISQKRVPFGFYNFEKIPSGYVFKTLDGQGNDHLFPLDNYTVLVTDDDFKLNAVSIPHRPFGKVLGAYHYLYKNNNRINITHGYTDTIYEYNIDKQTLMASYVLDYEDKKLPEKYLYDTSRSAFDNATKNNDYYFFIGEYLGTTSQNVFFLRNQYTGLQTVIYHNKKTGNLIGGTSANLNIHEVPPVGFPKGAHEDYFISEFHPNGSLSLINSSMISAQDKELLRNFKDDDNPILVFFQLKDF